MRDVEAQSDRDRVFGPAFHFFQKTPLNKGKWLQISKTFFNDSNGLVKPGKRLYGNFTASNDQWTFQHPEQVYSEFDVSDKNSMSSLGTLRLWDFSNVVDARFQTEDGRKEIAGREKEVFAYLKNKSFEAETAVLGPQASDPELGVNSWEVYDRRKNLLRFKDFTNIYLKGLTESERIELSKQILSQLKALHLVEVCLQDIGSHSVWLKKPSSVRFSHLMTAKITDIQSLGNKRYQFLSTQNVPENAYNISSNNPKARDIYLVALLIHKMIFGVAPESPFPEAPAEWDKEVDQEKKFGRLYPWFKQSLALYPVDRFESAEDALHSFNVLTEERPTRKEVIEGLERYNKFNSSRALERFK